VTNALPARKDSRVRETVLSPVAPQGFPGQTNLIDFGFDGFPDPLRASPGLELLKSATFFIDAAYAKTGDAYAFKQGAGGFALDARYGSSLAIGASDTNDPLLLPFNGETYVYLPGVAGNYANAPSIAAYNITGDIEVVVDLAMSDWFGSSQILIGRGASDPNRDWYLRMNVGGFPRFIWYPTGLAASSVSVLSTSAVPFTNGQRGQVKVTLDVDNLSGGYTVTFYTATDGVNFTLLSSTVTAAGVTSKPTVTASLDFNLNQGATELAGKLYRGIVRNGIGGATVFDANFTTGITSGGQATFTESSSNAATVTINRSTAGRKASAVTRPVWLFGTDDYMEVPDNALLNMDASQSFTVVAVVRQWATAVANGRYLAKGAAGVANAYALLGNATSATLRIDDMAAATASGVSSTATAGTLRVYSGVRDKTTRTVTTYANTVAGTAGVDATVEQFTNAFPVRIGADGGASPASYQDFELLAVAIFRRALTATEIASINTYYGTA